MPMRTIPPTDTYVEMTEDEYLAREPEAEYRSEFRQGRVYAMSGGTERHALIIGNAFAAIHSQLKGKACKAFVSDMRTKVAAAGLYTYPDILVVCGATTFDAKDKYAVTNPMVIMEVLSKSTEAYDRGQKFEYYQKLESLDTYVLISQAEIAIERFTLESGAWRPTRLTAPDGVLELPSIACRVPVSDIYDKVDFSEREE